MRILAFTSVPTHPVNAGNRARILAVCNYLRLAGHEVVVCCAPREEGDLEAMEKEFAGGFEFLDMRCGYGRPPAATRILRRLRRAIGDPGGHRMGLDEWHNRRVTDWLLALHLERRFDAVLVNYLFHTAILDAFPDDVLKVVECHDSFGDRHLRYLELGLQPEWYSTSVKEEFRGLSRADVVIAIQEHEAARFRQGLPSRTRVATVHPFMEPTTRVNRTTSPRGVVVASSNTINVLGVSWFLQEVAPLIRASMPDFELVLAGNVGNEFHGRPGVTCLGRVAEIRKAYEAGAIALNPIHMGTGFCIKTLEALAFGMPLVSTRTGIRGVESLDGKDCFIQVADTDSKAMAEAVVSLLANPNRMDSMARSAWTEANRWTLAQKETLDSIFAAVQPVPR